VNSTIRSRTIIKDEPEPAEATPPSSPKTSKTTKKTKRRTTKSMNLDNGEKSSENTLSASTELNISQKSLYNSQAPPVPSRTPIPPPRTDDTTAPISPPAAPKAPKGPPAPPKAPAIKAPTGERKALLSSIEGFNSRGLKKTTTNDRSGPKLGVK